MCETWSVGGRARKIVRIDLLGPLRVTFDDVAIDVGGPKVQALLVTLAHHLGEIVGLDTLFEALWGADPPKSARNVIQVRASGLRQLLEPSFDLRFTTAGYELDPAQISIDVSDFEDLVGSAERCLDVDPTAAVDLIDQALALWRGEPIAHVLDIRPLEGHLATLRDLLVRAQTMRLGAQLALGEHDQCAADAEALAGEHPYREDIRGIQMRALYCAGRQAAALGVFRRTRDLLIEELGIEPGPQLQTLQRQILNQDECLDPTTKRETNGATEEATLAKDNLRSEPNMFVDRPEIDAIVGALEPGRIVTVVGTGGIGKSRSVAAAARRCLDEAQFADGVWIVDLAPLPEGSDDVAVSAATAMRLGQEPGVSALDTIGGYLHSRRALLVLDNCEHVAASAAKFVDTIAGRCAGTAILTASRVRLGLLAESVITMERLPDIAAQKLLTARIAEVGAGPFSDDDCADLCTVLDNYPLAIELAAARTRSLGPREIATRLGEQPRLLGSWTATQSGEGRRRHADLSTALNWSIDQLSPRCKATLDGATVFVSDFDLDTAEVVLAIGQVTATDVAEDLGELVEHHLISRDHGRARFRVLEPIRQHLSAGATATIRDRYVQHFAAFAIDAAQGLRGPDEAVWWLRWRAELPHVREAIRLATNASDIELLDSVMEQMAITVSICVFTEPGEWAVSALRKLQFDPLEAPGVVAAAAAQFAHLDLIEECDAALGSLEAIQHDAWMRAIAACVGIFRDPSSSHLAEPLHEAAQACGDLSMQTLAKICRTDRDAVEFADRYGNPTLRVFARQWRSARIIHDPHSAEARRNKEELYHIALVSNNEHTIAAGQMFMALQHCFDDDPRRAGPLVVEMIERMVRVRSPHWIWHGVEVIANMLAMVRIDPYTSELLWAAVSASGRPPFSRVTRDPTLPIWVASQLNDEQRQEAARVGSALGMDEAANQARKAAERMSDADR